MSKHYYDRLITCIACGRGGGTLIKLESGGYKHKQLCRSKPPEPKPSQLVIAQPRLIRVSPDDPIWKKIQQEKEAIK